MYVFIEFIDICSTSLLYGIHSFSWKRSTQFHTESMDPSSTPNWIYIMYPTHILSSMSQTFTCVLRLSYIHVCDISWYFVCSPKTNKHITDFPWLSHDFVWLRSSDFVRLRGAVSSKSSGSRSRTSSGGVSSPADRKSLDGHLGTGKKKHGDSSDHNLYSTILYYIMYV